MTPSHLLPTLSLIFTIFITLPLLSAAANRRILHQPFFPLDQSLPPTISQPPFSSPSPQSQPQNQPVKYPFSGNYPPNNIPTQNQFFPFYRSPPPPHPPPSTVAFNTFPANISSLVIPSSSSHTSHKLIKLVSLILSFSLLSVVVLVSLLFLIRRCHHHQHNHHLKNEKNPLFPPNTIPSDTTDAAAKNLPPSLPRHTSTSNSSEFLYLGILSNVGPSAYKNNEKTTSLEYQSLGSPELQPLPPLPRPNIHQNYNNAHVSVTSDGEENDKEDNEEDQEEFFSPRGSARKNGNPRNTFNNSNSSRNSVSSLGSPSVAVNSCSPQSIDSKSPDSFINFPGPLPRFVPQPPACEPRAFSSVSSPSEEGTVGNSPGFPGVGKVPPPPPPPPGRLWEAVPPRGPPKLVTPATRVVQIGNGGEDILVNSESGGGEEVMKPKLKPLHWDKVRASSDRAMVWDQLKSSSFQLNEEMIETLFMVNSSNVTTKDGIRRQIIPEINQENAVLDPKKSQNIAILLRALNVTVDEVCEALIEGNADTLGAELLESLLKMAPSKEEERKLKDLKDEPTFKLGTAETFLKALLDIPFAFKRVDAMLYIANFESEVEYLKRSFNTLESACEELKSSRMFRKLLEAILKTGNRMNVGTNRGDAHAFKLDTLLKLVDVKGTDGKTTLLHFVVQEIIRAEGALISGIDHNIISEKNHQATLRDEVEYRKIGLQIVSKLNGELANVKKAAGNDAEVLISEVAKLAVGITKIKEALKLNEEIGLTGKFADFMNEFLNRAEGEIVNIQAQEGIALSMVKGLTEYFHGDSAKEEVHPFRVFMVVGDFLSILDRVCKDVSKVNDRTMVNIGREFQMPNNPGICNVFPGSGENRQDSSSDEESPSSS